MVSIACTGAAGFTNGAALRQLPCHDVVLVAACDLEEEKELAVQANYGFEKLCTDFRAVLDEVKPQAALGVIGPNVRHGVGGVNMQVHEITFPNQLLGRPTSVSALGLRSRRGDQAFADTPGVPGGLRFGTASTSRGGTIRLSLACCVSSWIAWSGPGEPPSSEIGRTGVIRADRPPRRPPCRP